MASLTGMTFDWLAFSICIIWAVTIATIDLITYKISNRSLALGVFLVWPALLLVGQRFALTLSALVLVVVALACGLTSVVGMGDVKLLLFLAPWLHYENVRNPLILLIGFSWIQLMAELVINRRFPKRIAFAPAILAAAALNMAT